MRKSNTLKMGIMLAMMSASESMSSTYDCEHRGSDILIKKRKKSPSKGSWYTTDSPEVKRMSK